MCEVLAASSRQLRKTQLSISCWSHHHLYCQDENTLMEEQLQGQKGLKANSIRSQALTVGKSRQERKAISHI